MKLTAKRIATLSILTALGLIMFMIESLFPPLFIPGAKMGLGNIFTLLTLIILSPVDAIILVILRTVLGSFFVGSMSTLIYSLSAGIVSVLISIVLVKFTFPRVSIIAISVCGAVAHNLTQNIVFCLISQTPKMFAYMPYLALLGVVAGVIVGFAVYLIVKFIPMSTFIKIYE